MKPLRLALIPRPLTTTACVTSLAACAGDDVGDDASTGSTGATAASATSNASDDATSNASDATSDASSDATSNATSDASTSSDATSDATESATEGGPTSTSDGTTGTTGATTEDPTTSTTGGTTGVALSGLEAYCDHYVDCGGTYYEDSQACVDASLNYWGECPSRRDALDAFGDCMLGIPCGDWNPDSYNPASTECADAWQALGESEPC